MVKINYIKRYLMVAILLFCVFSLCYGYQGKYPIQNFTPRNYKAGIQNIDFAQNRDMTIFVANNLGVLSFNGHDWHRYGLSTGKKQRSLAFDDTTNRLYVGSQGQFGYFKDDWSYVSLLELVPEHTRNFDEVWDVYCIQSKVYFCTFQGIFVYDGETITPITHKEGFERTFVAGGKLFTQNPSGRLHAVEGVDLSNIYVQSRTDQLLAGIIPHNEGQLLFYQSGYVELSTTFDAQPVYPDLSRVLAGKFINHVLQLSDGRLAISTQTAGIYLYDIQKNIIEHISIKDGLESNACLRAFQDYAGDLWVGMQNGIAIIHVNSPMRIINEDINLEGSGYEAYDTDKGTYYTTSNGIYFLEKDASSCIFMEGTAGPAYSMTEIAGRLYACHHTGLFLLDDTIATRVASVVGLWLIKPLSSNPSYVIGGTYSGLYLFYINKEKVLKPVQKIEGFNESSRFIQEDPTGDIWVSQYYKGLYKITLSEDLTQATVLNIDYDQSEKNLQQVILCQLDNDLFIASNAGLNKINHEQNQIDTQRTVYDIGQQPIYLIDEDQQKNVHVIADQTVGFHKRIGPNNYTFVPSSLYQLRYYLNNDLLHISTKTDDGVLYSAYRGFIQYYPELEHRLGLQNSLIVRRVLSVSQDSTIYKLPPFEPLPDQLPDMTLQPNTKIIQIEVESFQFSDMNNHQFRFALEGHNDVYGAWTNNRVKEYANLTEGNYVFKAQSRNYLGQIATSEPLVIRVKPPFYKSALAKLIYLFIAAITLWTIYRIQKRKFIIKTQKIEELKKQELEKNRQHLLLVEQQKEDEIAANQKKIIEIEQQKSQEVSLLKADQIQSELRHVNNLLAASTMNLVVKNEFIETIKEELKEVKRKGKNEETKRALERIVKEIDTSLRLNEDWKQFEHHFDQVHGDFLTRFRKEFTDLTPNEQKLAALLRLNLSTKEIANLMSISPRGVEVSRYRLRKKIKMDRGQNLTKYILDY